MPIIIANAESAVEVTIKAAAGLKRVYNVVDFCVPLGTFSAGATPTLEQFATNFRSFWRTNILPKLSSGYVVAEYLYQVLDGKIANTPPTPAWPYKANVAAEYAQAGVPASDSGTDISDPLPTFGAATVRKFTGLPGRNFKGSIHLAPIPESTTTFQSLTAGAKTAWDSAFSTLVTTGINASTSGTAAVFFPSVLSRKLWLGAGSAAPPQTPWLLNSQCTSMVTNDLVGSMIRRKRTRFI